MNPVVEKITERIRERSAQTRSDYLDMVQRAIDEGPWRSSMGCGNLAHAFAASCNSDKKSQVGSSTGNVGIVTAYNDMLSAHQPFATYPDIIKELARDCGGTAQVAGGVPAMCDGVTQGQTGMELSLFSRDVIAMAAAVSLTHNVYDAAVYLGICDKIVPGLIIAAGSFGHLPSIFLPAGPMPSGISNDEKAKTRQEFALGNIGKDELLASEMKAYHSPGTCTFYGTANTNQMLMEIMGLQLPGTSFVNPNTPLRSAFNEAGVKRLFQITKQQDEFTPVAHILDVPNFVNGIIGLHASGGSTNLVLHYIAMARAAGIILDVEDFGELSAVTPLMARVYPNGKADVNAFHQAGGMPYLIGQLIDAGLLHEDVKTVMGQGLHHYRYAAYLDDDGKLAWSEDAVENRNNEVISSCEQPFQETGGLKVLHGNLGRSIIKVSAVQADRWVIEAPASVFDSQQAVKDAFKAGELNHDCICVVRFQGPKSNGMPELHGLTPILGALQDQGFKVALVTDGRMSGASGKVPAAIHLAPEALNGGPIACIRDGDMIRLDAKEGSLQVLEEGFVDREPIEIDLSANQQGLGRDLFSRFRETVSSTSTGANIFFGE